MHFTIRQLRVFECVAKHLNYTTAADELFLSQPAVSMQVKQLEEQFGLALFERLGRRVFLTAAGEEVLRHVRALSAQYEELENTVARLKGHDTGRLRISVATTANYFVASLLATFNKKHPNVKISLDVTNRESLLRQLAENTVDLVIMGQPPDGSDYEAGVFMDNPLVVVAPLSHPLASRKNTPLRELAGQTFLVRESGSGTRFAMERFFEKHGIPFVAGMELGSNEAIKQSVQAGLGLGLLSRDTVEMEISLGRLVVLDIEHFPIMRHWYVVHRSGKRLSAVASEFKSFLLTSARALLKRDSALK
jgi:DNA-binding transcriptional LysR family regulator